MLIFLSKCCCCCPSDSGGMVVGGFAKLMLLPSIGLCWVLPVSTALGVGGSGLPAMLPGALFFRVRVPPLPPPADSLRPELTDPGRARMSDKMV